MEKVKTEVYEIFAPDPKYKVLVIPGNPGSSNLYLPLLMDLDEVFNNTCDIMLISHRGHTIEKYEEDELFTYEDQIEHVANIIKTNIDENPVVPIILVGHRLGCNILFEALKRTKPISNRVVEICIRIYVFRTPRCLQKARASRNTCRRLQIPYFETIYIYGRNIVY